jgi:hypothetical protein
MEKKYFFEITDAARQKLSLRKGGGVSDDKRKKQKKFIRRNYDSKINIYFSHGSSHLGSCFLASLFPIPGHRSY